MEGDAAAAIVLALLLLVFVLRQGRVRTSRVVDDRSDDAGRTVVDLAVPRTLLAAHLRARPEFVAVRISASVFITKGP